MWNPFKKVAEITKELRAITADSFGGFFDLFTTSVKGLELVPVYACVRIISQTISISPLKLYDKSSNGRIEITDSPLNLLFKNPYDTMTYYNWMNMMCTNMVARGNSYALIVRDSRFNVTELIPLMWDEVNIVRDVASDAYYYQITFAGKSFTAWSYEILHFKNYTEDGKTGLNPLEVHRKTIESASNEAVYNENFYKQASNISGVIESPKALDKNAVTEIKDSFGSNFGGVANVGKTAVLSDGKVYKQLKLLSPMDANYIESAKLTRADIGVIFGVPLNMLGDLSQATFSNITEMNRAFYKSTIAPYFTAIEQELSLKLLPESLQLTRNFEYYADILLSASKKERYEIYALGIRNGIINRNEARVAENLESKGELDEFLQESGVLTIAQANSNFNNTKGGDSNDTDTDDIKTDENDTDEVRAMVKTLNDVKAKIGRLELQHKRSSKVTPNKKVKT